MEADSLLKILKDMKEIRVQQNSMLENISAPKPSSQGQISYISRESQTRATTSDEQSLTEWRESREVSCGAQEEVVQGLEQVEVTRSREQGLDPEPLRPALPQTDIAAKAKSSTSSVYTIVFGSQRHEEVRYKWRHYNSCATT